MSKLRVGIYGGTFNPPHVGHVRAAEAFVRSVPLDKLIIMPDHLPPHKAFEAEVSADARFEMCKLAFGGIEGAEISDFEINRGGKSYTAVTLSALSSPMYELYFLCGTDMFLTLDTWYDFKTIFSLAVICCVRRESDEENTLLIKEKEALYKREYGAKIIFIENNVTEVSSSALRRSLSRGLADDAIPDSVREYIEKEGLYR